MKELSQSDIYSLLSTAIRQGRSASSMDSPWVRDVYDTYLVYSDTDGKLYQRSYEIDAVTEDVTLGDPVEVVQVTSYAPVARTSSFSLTAPATFSDQDKVTRRGPIFKAGTHNTAGGPYSMTEEELAAAVANFSPVPVDLDHHKTVLDGKLGQLSSVELGEGGVLFGTVELPRWLDDALGEGARKVSCAWDRASKTLQRLALTDTPRISEAALFSRYAEFAGARHSASDQADMQSIHDIAVKQGAGCTSEATYSHSHKEKKKMSILDKIKAAFPGASPEQLAVFSATDDDGSTETPPTPPPTPAPTPPTPPTPEFEALKKQNADLQARFAQVEAERRTEKATATVDALIRGGKLFPAERALTIAVFSRAMEDDERDTSLVTFSDADGVEVKGTRSQMLEAQYNARVPHGLTEEQVAAFALPRAGTDGETKEKQAARIKELAELTPMGKANFNGN